jgi:hypothetical protein
VTRRLLLLGYLCCVSSLAQQPEIELTGAMLAPMKLYLSQSSAGEQMKYQASLPMHQEIDLAWHSVPGLNHMIRQEEMFRRESHSPRSVSIVSVKTNVPGAACPCGLLLHDNKVLILGLTTSHAIRSITLLPDSRVAQLEGGALYLGDGDYQFRIPSDPELVTLRFLTVRMQDGHWKFRRIADLPLGKK